MYKIKKLDSKKLEKFFINLKLERFVKLSKNYKKNLSTPFSKTLLKPNLSDLYFIYNLIIKKKRITSLEFGCGFSSEIIALALDENKKKYKKNIKLLRRNHAFKNFVVDNEKKYLNILRKRSNYKKNIVFNYSKCFMDLYNNNYVIRYDKLPLVSPDFIYLDGPNPKNILNRSVKMNIKDKDFMPITCDILLIEYYLIPGTIVLIDGRGANAQYLNDNFKRKWEYKYFKNFDMHYFELIAEPLGKINMMQLNFFNNNY